MRLLTVPQFARRIHSSVDEVLALIANRDVKALRPDPEGGYRVLETEVDRLLQERMTRIKRPARADVAPKTPSILEPPTLPSLRPQETVPELEPTPARHVAMETHLTVVTALETMKAEKACVERLNSNLQAELFGYRQQLESQTEELHELRASLVTSSHENETLRLEKAKCEQQRVEAEQAAAQHLEALLERERAAESVQANVKKSFWRRLFG